MFISTHWITKRNPALERPELWQSKLKSGTNQHCNETWMRSFVSQEFWKKCEEIRTNVSHDVLVLYPGLQKKSGCFTSKIRQKNIHRPSPTALWAIPTVPPPSPPAPVEPMARLVKCEPSRAHLVTSAALSYKNEARNTGFTATIWLFNIAMENHHF